MTKLLEEAKRDLLAEYRSTMLLPVPNGIPQYLKNLPQWLCWRLEPDKSGKPTKVPYNARTGRIGKSNNPKTWSTFDTALAAYQNGQRYDGIGIAFHKDDGLYGADLDKLSEKAGREEIAQAIVARFSGTYCEVSPGGDGRRIFALGKLPRCGKGTNPEDQWIEQYDYTSPRFLTVTGHYIESSCPDVTEQKEAMDWLHEEYFKPKEQLSQNKKLSFNAVTNAGVSHAVHSEDEVIEKALSFSTGEEFKALFYGGNADGQDHSKSDYSLCGKISFLTQREDQVDSIFRQSALMRPKWDEPRGDSTYGRNTILKALENLSDTYQWPEDIARFEQWAIDETDGVSGSTSSFDPSIQNGPSEDVKSETGTNPSRGEGQRKGRKNKKPPIVVLHEILTGGLWAKGIFRYDKFINACEIQNVKGQWEKVSDEHYHQIMHYVGAKHRLSFARELVIHTVNYFCRQNTIDCLQDYLNGSSWDGTKRLDTFLRDAFGCEQNEYHKLVGAKFIESLVARGLKPGCKMDYCPIFISQQGAQKSKALAALGGKWFTDVLPMKITGRDIIYALQGVWLVEACELEAFTRADTETLKAFLSRRIDRADLKYRNEVEEFPRRCVISGTTNTQNMLKDPTGSRRFWPIVCGDISIEYVSANRDQLFAEAVQNHKNGVPWWPSEECTKTLEEHQDEHYQVDSREGEILEFVESRNSDVGTTDILNHLKVPLERQDRRIQMEVAAIMTHSGYVTGKQKQVLGVRIRPWLKNSFGGGK